MPIQITPEGIKFLSNQELARLVRDNPPGSKLSHMAIQELNERKRRALLTRPVPDRMERR
jgi:hypothetical protein